MIVQRRALIVAVALVSATACSPPSRDAAPAATARTQAPSDSQHAGITEPHGDHSPHHGGVVLMNGDLHYEVVFDRGGRHQVWFSSATREELPASVAADVVMTVTAPGAEPETLSLRIDDAGEAWVASGRPVPGTGVMVKLTYSVKGVPHEIEIPFS